MLTCCKCGREADRIADVGPDDGVPYCSADCADRDALGLACEPIRLDARIVIDAEADDPIECTLREFLRDNEDGIDAGQLAAIASSIARGEAYDGGGGAAPGWTIRPADR